MSNGKDPFASLPTQEDPFADLTVDPFADLAQPKHEEGILEGVGKDLTGFWRFMLRSAGASGNWMTGAAIEGTRAEALQDVDPERYRDAEGFRRTAALGVSAIAPGVGSGLMGVLTREAGAGAIYGALRPKEEGETLIGAMAVDAAMFAAFGGVLYGMGQAAKRALKKAAPKFFDRLFKGDPKAEAAAREAGETVVLGDVASPEVRRSIDLADIGYTTEFTDEAILMQATGMTDEFLRMPTVTPLAQREVQATSIFQPIRDRLKFRKKKGVSLTSGRQEPIVFEKPIETATLTTGRVLREAGESTMETAGVRAPLDPNVVVPSPIEGAMGTAIADIVPPAKPGVGAGTIDELLGLGRAAPALEPHKLQRKVLRDIEAVLKGKKPKAPAVNTAIKATDNNVDQSARTVDDALDRMGDMAEDLIGVFQRNPEAGFASMRVLTGLSGGGLMAMGATTDDPAKRNVLRAGGVFLAAASLLPSVKRAALRTGFGKNIRNTFHPLSALEGGAKEAAEAWQRTRAFSRTYALQLRNQIQKTFPDQRSRELLAYALDGEAIEFGMLTPAQQTIARELRAYNKSLGQALEATGSIDHAVQNYYTRIWPKEAIPHVQKLLRGRQGTVSARGPFSLPRQFKTLRSAEAWAKEMGIPGPRKDVDNVFAIHVEEALNAMGNARFMRGLERLGMVADEPVDGTWIDLAGALRGGLVTGKFAHPEVEPVLKAFFTPGAPKDAYDRMATLMLRSIMFWFWEHGLNVMRAGLAAGTGPASWMRYGRAITNADPLVLQASKDGLLLGQRSDLGRMASRAFETSLSRLGEGAPTLKKFIGKIGDKLEAEQRLLWEKIVPSIGLSAYAKEMRKFNRRFPHASEAQLHEAGRKAAKHANDVMGLVPKGMQSEAVSRNMRKFFFAPAWLRTRLNIQFNAWGEAGDVLSGKLDPRDAFYLQYKVRQALLTVGVTTALSFALSGKEPAFNERTGKFYARTGMKDPRTGRELGVDLVAWFQDDLRIANDPLEFLGHKANPLLKAASENLIEGRDYTGRPLEGGERIENLIRALGPVGAGVSLPFHVAQGNMEGTEAMRTAFRVAGLSGVSSLPTPADEAFSALAKRLLTQYGLSRNEENIYEISRMLKGNMMSGAPLIDQSLLFRLASMDRSEGRYRPITKTFRDGLEKLR